MENGLVHLIVNKFKLLHKDSDDTGTIFKPYSIFTNNDRGQI